MRILITNDDGIEAVGIRSLADVLGEDHEVYVIAPKTQKSAAGHGISVHTPITYTRLPTGNCKLRIAADGTPADCVKLAVLYFMKDRLPDLVISGINEGSNLGSDVIYSGTVSAALEGAYMGIPSVAVSNADRYFEEGYGLAAKFVSDNLGKILAADLPRYTVLNINYPPVRHRGVAVVPVGMNKYADSFSEVEEGVLQISGFPKIDGIDEDTDIIQIRKGFVTVSPVKLDRNDYECLAKLKKGMSL